VNRSNNSMPSGRAAASLTRNGVPLKLT
jgi:hypothetical protein